MKARLTVTRRQMRMRWAALVMSSFCVLAVPRAAGAQVAVLGPIEAHGEASDTVKKSISAALSEALRMQGFTVTQFDEAKPMSHDGKSARTAEPRAGSDACDDACADRLLRMLSADVIALTKVASDAAGREQRVTIALRDDQGHTFTGAAPVRDADLREATARALLEARAYQILGPGPWLRVEGTPENADVLIDGSVVGHVPYRAAIAPGHHELVVRDAGYVRFQKSLEVPQGGDRKLEVRVALEPAPLEAPVAALSLSDPLPVETGHVEGRSRAWLALPIAMEVVGIGLVTLTTVRLASGFKGCVDPDYAQRCTERRSVNTWPTVGGYGLGAVLIGSGIVWMVLGLSNEPHALAASIGIDHVSVTGSF